MKQNLSYAQTLNDYIVATCLWVNRNSPELADIYTEKFNQKYPSHTAPDHSRLELIIGAFLFSFSRVERMVSAAKALKDENDLSILLNEMGELYFNQASIMIGDQLAETSMRLSSEISLALAKHGAHDGVATQVTMDFFLREPGPYEDLIDPELFQKHLLTSLGVFRTFTRTYWESQNQ